MRPENDDQPTDHLGKATAHLTALQIMIDTEPPPAGKQQMRARHAFAEYVVGTAQAHALIAVAEHLKTFTDAWTAAGQAVVGALSDLAVVVGALRPPDRAPNPCMTVACQKAHDLDVDPVHMDHEGATWTTGQATDAERLDVIRRMCAEGADRHAKIETAAVLAAANGDRPTLDEWTDGATNTTLPAFQRGWRAGQAAGLVIAEEKLDKIKTLAETAMVHSPSSTLASILYSIDGRESWLDVKATPDDEDEYTPADAAADHIVDH